MAEWGQAGKKQLHIDAEKQQLVDQTVQKRSAELAMHHLHCQGAGHALREV